MGALVKESKCGTKERLNKKEKRRDKNDTYPN
jgi:hypothetical protein